MSDDEWETDGDFVGGDAFNQKDQAHHSSTSAVKGASGGVGAGLNLSQMEEELRQVEHDKEKAYSEQRRQNLYGGDRCATDQTNASLGRTTASLDPVTPTARRTSAPAARASPAPAPASSKRPSFGAPPGAPPSGPSFAPPPPSAGGGGTIKRAPPPAVAAERV